MSVIRGHGEVFRAVVTATLLAAVTAATGAASDPGSRATAMPVTARAYGIKSRSIPKACLEMPPLSSGRIPELLSETGAFSNIAKMVPSKGLIPYDLAVAFWSDGADKSRWAALPDNKIEFSATGEWKFPACSVFIKSFELSTDARHAASRRRLETRLLVRDSAGGVYGVTYKWRPDGSDAELLSVAQTEDIAITALNGDVRRQTWYYPSRQDCLTCHTANAGGVLGLKTRQMNRDLKFPGGIIDNELRAWNHLGLFKPAIDETQLGQLPALASADDAARSLEDRARSYLDANCSQCHRPGGTVANFDARYDTPLDHQLLIDGPVLIDQGIDRPRVIAPHDIWRSLIYMRVNTVGDIKMPPLARETIDRNGVALLNQWISGMPGRPVLAPPVISPAGGTFPTAVEVSLSQGEPGADIRYTLDGSVPGPADPRFEKPLKLTATTVLRARAYKEGFTRSITEQQLFIIAP
jgi:uncharacterized repeat protein (TIGR03806 family)